MESQCTNLLVANKALEIKLWNFVVVSESVNGTETGYVAPKHLIVYLNA